MKTRLMNNWFVGLAVGLLLAMSALGWAGPPWGKGGIPAALKACEKALKASEAELASCLEQQGFTFPGDGRTGAVLSYTDNGDGTFTDDNTGLMWEIKLAEDDPACVAPNQMDRDVHCVNNGYTWSAYYPVYPVPDGTAFTWFLAELNTPPGFAGHTDWRLPTVKELLTLVDYSVSYPGPVVSANLPGATKAAYYWSSTSSASPDIERASWHVDFSYGSVYVHNKRLDDIHVRAVRDGW